MDTTRNYLTMVLISIFITTCSSGSKNENGPEKIIPVTVAEAVQKDMPVQIKAIGNVEAFNTVSVRARVGGELEKVYFNEGDYIKEGAPLFLIDPRPYAADLKQAEANLAKDIVQADNAERDAARYADLFGQGIVTKEQNDQLRTTADALNAAVNADRAAVENAKLQLEYCYIRSPISGITGKLMINQGNMVKANDDTPLITINQIIPIYVSFSVPEKDLLEIKKYQISRNLKVEALIPENIAAPAVGELTFIDNAVNTTTGTILLKATFDNSDKILWPGQFVNVVLTLAHQTDVTVVPSQAVQTGQGGSYIFVVKDDRTVEMRIIDRGRTYHGETIVKKGLNPGEIVVTDGQLQLSPGTKVEIKNTQKTEREGS